MRRRTGVVLYDGHTGGTRCSRCDKILTEPEVVPALGHKFSRLCTEWERLASAPQDTATAAAVKDAWKSQLWIIISENRMVYIGGVMPAVNKSDRIINTYGSVKTATSVFMLMIATLAPPCTLFLHTRLKTPPVRKMVIKTD